MTQEEIKIYNENSKKEFEMSGRDVSLGFVVPFVLFICGIITPFVTEDILVWIFSLIPFYGYIFTVSLTSRGLLTRNVLSVMLLTTILGFIVLGMSIFFGNFNGNLGISFGMMKINSFISIPVGVVMWFSHRFENCIPWPYYYFMGQTFDD